MTFYPHLNALRHNSSQFKEWPITRTRHILSDMAATMVRLGLAELKHISNFHMVDIDELGWREGRAE